MDSNVLELSLTSAIWNQSKGNGDSKEGKDKKEKAKQQSDKDKIKRHICALLNSTGGKLVLNMADDGENPVTAKALSADDIIRPIEQTFQKIIETDHLTNNMGVCSQTHSQITYAVKAYPLLCTLNYNLYLPSDTQVMLISPHEITTVKNILNIDRIVDVTETNIDIPSFVRGHSIGIKESKTVEFKNLKAETTKCNDLASRIVNNKFTHYVSAFANHCGGRLFYGIDDDGIVEGELVTEKDKKEVTKTISKYIKKMIWPEHIDEPQQGKQWDITFDPVKDQEGNTIPSTFVIVISITVCQGGVFCAEPESYHIVDNKVEKMAFLQWKQRFLYPNDDNKIVRSMSRCDWSSRKLRKTCDSLDGGLLKLINNGKWDQFEIAVHKLKQSSMTDVDIQLVVLSKWFVFHYRQSEYEKAENCLTEFNKDLAKSKDSVIFEIRGRLILSAMERTRGDYKRAYEIAKECLPKVEQISACILTVEFHVHFATVLTIIVGNKDLRSDQSLKENLTTGSFKDEAILFYNKALQHLRETDYVPSSKADMEQKTHINLAILNLGCSLSGDFLDKRVTKEAIESASTSLQRVNDSIITGRPNPLTGFRKCHHKFAESSLFYRISQLETSPERRVDNLEAALQNLEEVKYLAKKYTFHELSRYAENHTRVYEKELTQAREENENLFEFGAA